MASSGPDTFTRATLAQSHDEPAALASAQRALLNSIPDVCWIKDREGRLTAVNEVFGRRYGMTTEEAVGKTDFDIYPREKAEQLRAEDDRVMVSREPLRYESAQNYQGTECWVEVVKSPIFNASGNVVGTVGIARDITNSKRLNQSLTAAKDAADAASDAKSGFLAAMSHEIRTPMNGVLGMLELLALSPLSQDQKNTLSVARKSAGSLLRLIDDILDFSKIEAGRLEIHPEVISIQEMARQTAATHLDLAARKDISLELELDSNLSAAHQLDGLRFTQILNNLLSNAIKFTDKGLVLVSLAKIAASEGLETVEILVKDSGIGISPEQQAVLFQPFVQGDAQTTRRFGGTGLGLAICNRLVGLMNGHIHLESSPGKGTTVRVQLPLRIENPSALERNLPGIEADFIEDDPIRLPSGKRILVAEDHPVNLMLIQRQLALIGCASDLAHDGVEALERWKTGNYALILADCNMPRMDGYQLAREIRRLETATGRAHAVPIVACTANAQASDAEICYQAGMNDYLSKPITLSALKAKIRPWINRLPDLEVGSSSAPETGNTSGNELLNSETLEQFTGGDKKLLREILQAYYDSHRADMSTLAEAVSCGDLELIARTAHRAKGASRMIGAYGFAAVMERIELAAKSADLQSVQETVRSVDAENVRLSRYLEMQLAL